MKDQTGNIVFRYGLFIIGLFIAALGVAFSTKAGLGTSPVASVPYSVSLMSPLLSFGGWLNLWSVIQISIQVLLLRRNCKPAYGRHLPETVCLHDLQLLYPGLWHLAPVQGRGSHAAGRGDEQGHWLCHRKEI